MKRTVWIGGIAILCASVFAVARGEDAPYSGSRFAEVWQAV